MSTQTLTITEALAQLKIIKDRVNKAWASIGPYATHPVNMVDPLQKSGGSPAFIQAQRQSIKDMVNHAIKLRCAIAASNANTQLTIGNISMSVAEWIVWRREWSEIVKSNVSTLLATVQKKRLSQVVNATTGAAEPTVIVNVDEAALLAESNGLIETLGVLDGKLSLLNATTTITV